MTDRTSESGTPRGGIAPVAAFSLLGDATRLEIVNALHRTSTRSPVPFSTLYDRIETADSSQFNYHLQQLSPHFVSKTDDGYALTSAGRRIARAVVAGTYTDVPRLEPYHIDGDCYACGATALRASYVDERFQIECWDCGEVVLAVNVPPTVVRGRDPDAVVDAFDRWSRAQVEQARRGLCPDCGGAVEPSVTEQTNERIAFDAVARFDCTTCGRTVVASVGGIAYLHPPVELFHRRRGRSLRDRHYWEIEQYISGNQVRVLSRDPWRVRVSFFVDGDACHVEIDESLEVAETRIVTGETPDEGT